MKGLHRSIKLSFMLVGHTKFSPDWCFGLMKRRFRISKVDCLDDLVNVVQGSVSVNEVQLVGSQQGEPIVDTFDWVGFFGSHFMKIFQITRQHHFQFTAASPGTVTVKEFNDSLERQYTLTLDMSIAARNPEIIVPSGLPSNAGGTFTIRSGSFVPKRQKISSVPGQSHRVLNPLLHYHQL